jgi:hypothetical protein
MKTKYKDNLSRPFEKPETAEQRLLHDQIRQLCKQDFVIKMSYPQIFDVFDRIKLAFQLDMLKREGIIEYKLKGVKK